MSADDPTERHWNGQVDQAGRDAARAETMDAIRADVGIRGVDAKISEQRSIENYTRLSRHIRNQRNDLEQRFRECRCFSERLCEDWADQVAAIDVTGEDGLAAVYDVSYDLKAASERLQRDLKEIAATIADQSATAFTRDDRDTPVLVQMHRAKSAAFTIVRRVRSQIAASKELRADTRDRWLRSLPDPEQGLSWLCNQRLQEQVMRELANVAEFTAGARRDLEALEQLLTLRADT